MNRISRGVFATLQIGLVAGRDFDERDDANAAHVGIVNETLVKRFWPNQSAVGRRLRSADGTIVEVVGVARDSKYESLLEPATPLLYRPIALAPPTNPSFLVSSSGDSSTMLTLLRTAIADIDPELVPYNMMALDDRLNLGLAINRAAAIVAGVMGLLAFALGSLGIYGTIAFLVQQRRREIGIRVALGAAPRQVMRLILRQGLAWAMWGLLLGLAGAWLMGLGLTRFLQGVNNADPLAFVLAPLLLAVSVYVACYFPARRALRVDPIETLRNE